MEKAARRPSDTLNLVILDELDYSTLARRVEL